jgi:GntR family transcriptional regulator
MEFGEREPIYLQISSYINEQILSRRWNAGDRIPSVRELAVAMEVNPNTVSRTYLMLQDKGLIENQRGIGYFVSQDAMGLVVADVRNRFEKEDLPKIFKTMDLLSMAPDELLGLYKSYKERSGT